MAAVSSSQATEAELGAVMRDHDSDRTVLEVQWRGELATLRETQRRTYHQWIEGAYKEMTSSGGRGTFRNHTSGVCSFMMRMFFADRFS
jgi:hypothetical protein